jgi:hypothetical protein
MVLPLLTALLLTQSAPTDTLPFHRGEWATQFAGGGNFSSLGFLKLRGPKQAVVLDIRVGAGHGEQNGPATRRAERSEASTSCNRNALPSAPCDRGPD